MKNRQFNIKFSPEAATFWLAGCLGLKSANTHSQQQKSARVGAGKSVLFKHQLKLRKKNPEHLFRQINRGIMEILSSLFTLQPGMFILRHPKGGLPPLSVSRAPGNASTSGKLELLSTPSSHGSVLRDGADCIVMLVTQAPVELVVSAYMTNPGAVVPALKIDQIGLDAPSAAPALAAPKAVSSPVNKTIEISPTGISIIGHIQSLGDVVVSDGQQLGDPAMDLRLEGFQIMWPNRPKEVDLVYGVSLEGSGATPLVKTGQFCGTRQEARRITEVSFALVGPDAHQFQLEGTAYFSGGFKTPVQSGMALSGPSGLEHLTSICLTAVPATPTQQVSAAPKNAWDESPRTKVFKAKAAPTKAVAAKAAPAKAKVTRKPK
jgi:hypothetical protein